MLAATERFIQLAREGQAVSVPAPCSRQPKNVVVCGMGGSAIAGGAVRDAFRGALPVPLEVSRSFSLPAYAGKDTLAVLVSYSGNTAETLTQFRQAGQRRCARVALCSGGALARRARRARVPCLPLPGGLFPRDAFSFTFFALLRVLEASGLGRFRVSLRALARQQPRVRRAARRLAPALTKRFPVIASAYPSAGLRFKSQLNENAKIFCKHAVVPELAHHEIESWAGLHGEAVFVFLQRARQPASARALYQGLARLLKGHAPVHALAAPFARDPEALLWQVWLADYASYYAAGLRGADPASIPFIAALKKSVQEAR